MVKRRWPQGRHRQERPSQMLCHTYATELYRQSKDIRLVQKALSHASLSTTMIDTHIVDDDREAAIRLLNI